MDSDQLSSLLTIGGVGLVAMALSHFFGADFSDVPRPHLLTNLLVTGGSGLGVLYIGYWHSKHSFSPRQNRRVIVWTVGGAVVLTIESLLTQPLIQEQVTGEELVHILQINVGTGLLFGAIAGSFGARALSNAATVARAETRVETLEAEQERWTELNRILRHYLLNSVTVITHHLEQLRSNVPAESRVHLETIEDRVETIATIGTHVDRLGPSLEGSDAVVVPDLRAMFETAAARAEARETTTVETPACEVTIRAGAGVEEDLALLIEALLTVMETDGSVTCTCERRSETVVCRLLATPAELPPAVEAAIFEPIERKSGLKLYLAEISMDTYADLALTRNCDDTVEFEITFETVEDEP